MAEGKQRAPNFLYIGPDKSGSTWLHQALELHPDIFVPTFKDVYYFDRYYNFGDDWYLKIFNGAQEEFRGEISHDYLFSADAARRILEFNPKIKIITILRDPMSRSVSHYQYLLRSGLTKKCFSEAILEFPEIIDNSHYERYLPKYLDIFDRSNVGIFVFEDLAADPQCFANKIYEFIGASEYVDPVLLEKKRGASAARSFYIARFVKMLAIWVRNMGFPGVVGFIKNNNTVSKLLYKPKLDTEVIAVKSVSDSEFVETLNYCEGILGRDLSNCWSRS